MTTKVLYEDADLLAVYKPEGLPTVPLKGQNGESLLSDIASAYPEVLSVQGKNPWEGGIIHRLDTPTQGIVLAARTQEAYDNLLKQQESDAIVKVYRATVSKGRSLDEGFEPFFYQTIEKPIEIKSWFRSFGPKGASVRPVLRNERLRNGKIYVTDVEMKGSDTVLCTITRGFRHQIRCHLAWAGYPIVGDTRYGGVESEHFGLEAIKVVLKSPSTGKKLIIEI